MERHNQRGRALVFLPSGQLNPFLRYAGAVGVTAVATMLRVALQSALPTESLFLPFLSAVILSAWLYGTGPAVLATVLGGLSAEFVVMRTQNPLESRQVIQLALYSLCSLLCILTSLMLHRAALDASKREDAVERGRAQLRRATQQWDEARESLREKEAWLLLAERSAQLGSWSRNLSTGEAAWSESLEDIFGTKPQARSRPDELMFSGIHEDDVDRVREATAGAIRDGREYDIEYRIRRTDGTIRWVAERGQTTNAADGSRRLSGVTMDVTERKQIEERARELRAEIMQFQVNETARVEEELGKVRDQLVKQTRLAAIGQLSASIAHDLRNPLGVIRNAAYLLRRRFGKSSEHLDMLNMIEEEVRTADTIITNLMEMTRGRDPKCGETEIGAMVRELTRRLDASGRINWLCDLKPNPFVAWVDAGQFRQVLQNLLQNAVESMKGRGDVTIAAWRAAGADYLEVRDTGPGIPDEIRPRLFEPLVTSKKTGTGLGLLLCRQIVSRHGGEISVAEKSGTGACFRIRLPRPVTITPISSGN